jgi:hypothetical protein
MREHSGQTDQIPEGFGAGNCAAACWTNSVGSGNE